ncbi:tetratricopeptide repeat protein [Corallococcus interemptor]|uniref:tetratricopeptide repeat protein n=1 Tax=Corallococcus TaxID=83461 RepID=UPI001CC17799|nr:tetratricopeptide repeat protein [Corallococcus sp. AS-1-6]MBZ4377156.1 tetratricopeptide repeat protein [Corallococcus sp. AS-1-6]
MTRANDVFPVVMESPSVLLLECEPGARRQALLARWADEAGRGGARVWSTNGDMAWGGPWAGLRDLLAASIPALREEAPGLLVQHDYELLAVLPSLRREMKARHTTLTDGALSHEKVRNFPADRVFRISHGLIDLMAAWKRHAPPAPWVILCDAFDQAGKLVQHFYLELLRRRAQPLGLRLVLAVAPGQAEPLMARLPRTVPIHHVREDFPREAAPAALAPDEASRRAEALEAELREDPIALEMRLPELLRLWEASGREAPLFEARVTAFRLASHYGLYSDALHYGEPLREQAERMAEDAPGSYWTVTGLLFNSYSAHRNTDAILALATRVGAQRTSPLIRTKLHYTLGMLHGRFLARPDLERAEHYLDLGLEDIDAADIPEEERIFLRVFNRNALAFVRHRQGRSEEAIELCRAGFQQLESHLHPERHRLHRSVLLYNIAQVLAGLGSDAQAIEYYTAAIQMDPDYSEYFNERGSLLMRGRRYAEALEDFQRALQLSPPYAEVHINRGQCLRAMGRMEEAAEAYSTALDLEPSRLLALLGRAQAHEELGRVEAAIADYSGALALQPSQPTVLANRSLLHYSQQRLPEALADLNAAIALAPTVADFYTNRAIVLAELKRRDEAASDLRAYLDMAPEAEDRASVQERLAALTA